MRAPELDGMTAAKRLGFDDTAATWLAELESVGAPPVPVELPHGDAARTALSQLGVTDEDIAEMCRIAAKAFDHFILLIYPTAVLAIAASRGLSYAELIGLSTGAFVAFGLFSLPAGWLADRIGRRNLFAIFFLGYGASCMVLAFAMTPIHFAVGLLVLGVFSAIYHPVGSVMLVSHTDRLGRDLGINGVCGNMGAALAAVRIGT